MKNLFDIKGKVALVTGGSSGIGEMIATGFVENGAKVYITSRKAHVCDEVAARLSEIGECVSLPGDLSSMEGVEAVASELAKREEKIDILVNNAGATWGAPIDEFPEDGWDKVMDLNVKFLFFLTQKMLPLLRAAATAEDPARVINIASVDGMRPPAMDTYSYPASKSAVIHLTRTLGKHLASDNINVNSIAPGPFVSRMTAFFLKSEEMAEAVAKGNPRGRIGTPEDAAGLAIFLSSRASAYITGVNVPLDGGLVNLA